ncbi:hypothetical protein [Brevundimonas sp.]|uniref:hypothetical protein n=1 Tax=Brevundimonas sp. TaxID=1871086 RepID=UPI002FC67BE8
MMELSLADTTRMLVDGFGAIGALAVALVLWQRARRSTVQNVLLLVFGLSGLFYACRALVRATGFEIFGALTLLLACALPLGALLLAETLLRRHAPLWIKITIGGGTLLGIFAALLAGSGIEKAFSLAIYVPCALLLVLGLIVFRRRDSLSPMENTTLNAYGRALLATGVLALTDFGIVSPFGLSALGMLGLAYAAAAGANAPKGWLETAKELSLAFGTALLLAGALLLLHRPESRLDAASVLVVTIAALLALSVLLRLRSGGNDQQRRLFDQTLTDARTDTLSGFIGDASRVAPLQGLVLVQDADLKDYDINLLPQAFDGRAVIHLSSLWGAHPMADAREQLRDLLLRHNSTHAILIGDHPLQIGLVALGGSAMLDEDERDLALFQKMAALIVKNTGAA